MGNEWLDDNAEPSAPGCRLFFDFALISLVICLYAGYLWSKKEQD